MNTEVETLDRPVVAAVSLDENLKKPRYQQVSEPIHRKVGLTSLFDDLKDAGLDPETEILEY